MSNDTVSITVSRTDWEAVLAALKTAAEHMRERSWKASDPEVHYNLDKAASRYYDLAVRMSALEVN